MSGKSRLIVLLLAIALIVLGLALFDLVREGEISDPANVALELADSLVFVAAMGAVAWTVHGLRDLRENQRALTNNLARAIARGDVWREERKTEIAALGQAIEEQFRTWQLTPAEIDIAGLMLKGAALKEIALARDTSEATIRQQAQAIYRKSGLSGRAELSAYFLESLFETVEERGRRRAALSLVRPGGH